MACRASRPGPSRAWSVRWEFPAETVAKLNAELTKALNAADMKERFAKQGTEVRTGTPESLGAWMTTEQARWARVVKESGVKFE